ncbi:MAG: Rpn family recombination-promoting nuclease/putative transposase [Blautia sp.]|jgi:predicted transposase/invertase (TIGR01784 family)
MQLKKALKDLNLLDRFLFAEAMEDPENMQIVLEIILGKEIVLKHLPKVEAEKRTSPLFRFVKLDVLARAEDDTLYNTEVQRRNTNNLPHRSRFYQGMIDGTLLDPGESDFNEMNDVYIILITPFDIFGLGRYQYTFRMACQEDPALALEDGAVRIFLNTRGNDPENIRPELIELLRYMEHTTEQTARTCKSKRIHILQERIQAIKSNEEVSVRFMQEWEERALERQEAMEEGRKEGRKPLLNILQKKLDKGKSVEVIADELEESVDTIRALMNELHLL